MDNGKTKNKYITLFLSACFLSSFAFGGGYAIVPLMQKKFVNELGWIDEDEMINLIAISQTAPGPVAVDAFLLVGLKVAGVGGAIVSVLGTLLPPFALLSVVSAAYSVFRDNAAVGAVLNGMQAGVAAIIVNVVFTMGGKIAKDKDFISAFVMVAAFAASYFKVMNIILIILICGILGVVRDFISKKRNSGIK